MITPQQLAEVAAATLLDPRPVALRQRFPDLHFSECSADDVAPRYQPALDSDAYDFYLIAGVSGHCLALTSDPAPATGILLAAKVAEE